MGRGGRREDPSSESEAEKRQASLRQGDPLFSVRCRGGAGAGVSGGEEEEAVARLEAPERSAIER